MNKNYTKLATLIFIEACEQSTSSNWSVTQNELEFYIDNKLNTQDLINIIAKMVENFGNAILDITLSKKKITCCEPPREEYAIDFVLGTDYCLTMEEKENV